MATGISHRSKLSAKKDLFNLATWNIQGGLNSTYDAETLIQDMHKYRIDIAALQETRCGDYNYSGKYGKLVCLAADPNTPPHQQYGQGFYISDAWMPHLYGIKRITDRISVIQFKINRTRSKQVILTILNIYAPTSQLVTTDLSIATDFYETMHEQIVKYERKSYLLFIAGDMNAKLGLRTDDNKFFLGKHGKGTRNRNCHLLANFLAEHQYFAANTAFKHSMRHISTWYGHIQQRHIYNQIDYIFIPANRTHQREFLKNARAHGGTSYPSDHKLVTATLLLRAAHFKKKPTKPRRAFDASLLPQDSNLQQQFSASIQRSLETHETTDNPDQSYTQILETVTNSATLLLKCHPDPLHTRIQFSHDVQLQCLIKDRKDILRRLRRHRPTSKLKIRYNRVTNTIKARIKLLQNEKLHFIANTLEEYKGNKKSYEAMRMLKKTTPTPFTLLDPDCHILNNAPHLLPIIQNFYTTFFNQDGITPPSPWIGDPRPLRHPIHPAEVTDATTRLSNGRAAGIDGTPGELYKYGGAHLHTHIAATFNSIFTTHQTVQALGQGILITINKPGKPHIINNTRPLTLLTSLRKILSLILLNRIYPKVDKYISISQSAYRKNRSTADLLWAYRFYMATTQKYKDEFNIMGIDLSKAFDCINRSLLLETMQTLLDEDEYRILLLLITNTTLRPRVQGTYGDSFPTSIGVPQGDALSPILFAIYLETALRYHLSNLPTPYSPDLRITHYADDTDLVTRHYTDILITNLTLPTNLSKYNLQMNTDKTEICFVDNTTSKTATVKKLGSKLSASADIKYRIMMANQSFGTLWKLWLNRKEVTTNTKLRIYNACIKPILLYNTSSTPASDHMLEPMAAAHRRHLRHLLGIHHPRRITNERLYTLTKTRSIKLDIAENRLKLFGHILRSGETTPAFQAMLSYYTNPLNLPTRRGRNSISLATLLDRDVRYANKQLTTLTHFRDLQTLASDRDKWRTLVAEILRHKTAAENTDIRRATATRKRKRERTVTITYTGRDQQPKRIRLTALSPLILRLRRHKRPRSASTEHDGAANERNIRREFNEEAISADNRRYL